MAELYINQLLRLATAKRILIPLGCMLVESFVNIDSDTGVKRVVGTEDDIDGPVHGSQAGQAMRIFKG